LAHSFNRIYADRLTSKLRSHAPLTVAVLALFFAVGGPSFAAGAVSHAARLITGKQVKDSSITTKDIKNRSLLAQDFKAGQLPSGPQGPKGDQGLKGDPGTVDTSNFYDKAQSDSRFAHAGSEAVHAVGAPNEPPFVTQTDSPVIDDQCTGNGPTAWSNYGGGFPPAGFYRDPSGVVHLQGLVHNGVVTCAIFQLPAGYRPADRQLLPVISNGAIGRLDVLGTSHPDADFRGMVIAYAGSATWYSLNGISFRCAPSGSDGCP
jgi:hypothetical protein